MKCFSLTCFRQTNEYDNRVIPLLRRMSHLEKLTLYIRCHRSVFVDGTHLHKQILTHMLRLHTFIFYISTEIYINHSVHRLCDNDIQQTFTKIGYYETACNVNYYRESKAICHVFSLPFLFDHFEKMCNNFPSMVFNHVTCLTVADTIPFSHEFFIRIAKDFPSLKFLSIFNWLPPSLLHNFLEYTADNIQFYSAIEYPNLTSLDVVYADIYYLEQFLLDTKTYAPRLTEIEVNYNQLKTVTKNFTRDATRRNCANIKRLIFDKEIDYPKEMSLYFPLL